MTKQNLTKKKIVLLIILVIIVYMANETWGMMPKSQVDGQLIEERIAQMIAEHESDPEAHLGEGESLQAHRQNDVIDHPAFSVVPDKVTRGNIQINNDLSRFSSYDYSGEWSAWGGGEALDELGSGAVHDWLFVQCGQLYPNTIINFSKKPIFNITYKQTASFVGTLKMLAGHIDNNQGFGFVQINGTLYGSYFNSSGTRVDTSLLTVTPGTTYRLEARFIYTGEIEFWVNDVLEATVGSITDKTPENATIFMPWIDINKSSGGATEFSFSDPFLSADF